MEDRDLDFEIAEKLTLWTPIPNEDGWQSPDGSHKHWPGPPEYSSKIADTMEVEDRIAALHLQSKYVHALVRSVTDPKSGHWQTWNVIHATPRQRCEAALSLFNGDAETR